MLLFSDFKTSVIEELAAIRVTLAEHSATLSTILSHLEEKTVGTLLDRVDEFNFPPNTFPLKTIDEVTELEKTISDDVNAKICLVRN